MTGMLVCLLPSLVPRAGDSDGGGGMYVTSICFIKVFIRWHKLLSCTRGWADKWAWEEVCVTKTLFQPLLLAFLKKIWDQPKNHTSHPAHCFFKTRSVHRFIAQHLRWLQALAVNNYVVNEKLLSLADELLSSNLAQGVCIVSMHWCTKCHT